MTNNYGQRISRTEGSAYFKRYVSIRNRLCKKIKTLLQGDPEGQRFFTGRLNATDPAGEDLVYLFNPDSLKRLLDVIQTGKYDSLFVFVGTRDDVDPDQGETNGRPTLLLFPAKQVPSANGTAFEISGDGEEHPGSGGTGTSGIMIRDASGNITASIPDVLYEEGFHIL